MLSCLQTSWIDFDVAAALRLAFAAVCSDDAVAPGPGTLPA